MEAWREASSEIGGDDRAKRRGEKRGNRTKRMSRIYQSISKI